MLVNCFMEINEFLYLRSLSVKSIFASFLFLTISLVFAQSPHAHHNHPPHGEILGLRGTAEFSGKDLKQGDKITKNGEIKTFEKSFLKLYVPTTQSTIIIGPNSTMKMSWDQEAMKKKEKLSLYTLTKGFCRWTSGKTKKLVKGGVTTPTASLGVRGTDFWVNFNPLLQETEAIIFEGEVVLQSLKHKGDSKRLKSGQWGGLGGRFGENIGRVIDLPTRVLKEFREKSRYP